MITCYISSFPLLRYFQFSRYIKYKIRLSIYAENSFAPFLVSFVQNVPDHRRFGDTVSSSPCTVVTRCILVCLLFSSPRIPSKREIIIVADYSYTTTLNPLLFNFLRLLLSEIYRFNIAARLHREQILGNIQWPVRTFRIRRG